MSLETFPKNESAKRMLSYITSEFYDESYVGKWIFEVMGREIEEAEVIFSELPYQAFPETATWGLGYLEEKYSLPNRRDLSDEERRKLIIQKRDFRAPMTPWCMEHLLKTITDCEVHVADINDLFPNVPKIQNPNIFQVILMGDGSTDIKKIRVLLNQIKQSHTLYDLIYYIFYEYKVEVKYKNRIAFQSIFYPRYNLPYHYLEGAHYLSGKKPLNGYNFDSSVDFYPVQLWIKGEINQDTKLSIDLTMQSDMEIDRYARASLGVRGKMDAGAQATGDMQIQGACRVGVSLGAELTVEDSLRFLDGEHLLDGKYLLNSDIYYYKL